MQEQNYEQSQPAKPERSRRIRLQRTSAPAVTVCLLLVPVSASANASMGLFFGVFPMPIWMAYVAFCTVFEAYFMGRLLRAPFIKVLPTAIGANFLTAIVGLGLAEVFFHTAPLNPNPFKWTLTTLAAFALVSGAVEGCVWDSKRWGDDKWQRTPLLASLVVHAACIIPSFAMLLLPSRPYPGLELFTTGSRANFVTNRLDRALLAYEKEHGALPHAMEYQELLREVAPFLDKSTDAEYLWPTEFKPHFSRFDTSEQRREKLFEWNPAAAGLKKDPTRNGWTWLVRGKPFGYPRGLVFDRETGIIQPSNNAKPLGLPGL